jgi:hypothetical protein
VVLGLVGAQTRFHASTGISATQPMHLVCAGSDLRVDEEDGVGRDGPIVRLAQMGGGLTGDREAAADDRFPRATASELAIALATKRIPGRGLC